MAAQPPSGDRIHDRGPRADDSVGFWIAGWLARAGQTHARADERCRRFSRGGWAFITAVVSLVLVPISPTASVIVAALLAALNALDGVFNLCVGCVIYTYIVLPYHNRTSVPSLPPSGAGDKHAGDVIMGDGGHDHDRADGGPARPLFGPCRTSGEGSIGARCRQPGRPSVSAGSS